MWARLSASSEDAEAREHKEGGTVAVLYLALSPAGAQETGAGNGLPGISALESKSRRLKKKLADCLQGAFFKRG